MLYRLRSLRPLLRSKVTSTTVVCGYSKEDYQNAAYLAIEKVNLTRRRVLNNSQGDVRAGIDNLGEDAFFVNRTADQFDSFGVADGVGGWRNQGVDPSLFSS